MTPRPTTRLLVKVLPAAVVFGLSLTAFVVLAALVHGTPATGFDRGVDTRIRAHVSDGLLGKALHLSDPKVITVLTALVVVWALALRRWSAAVLAIAVPVASVLVTEHLLKPLVHRTESSFPSGHEAGAAGIACVAGLLLLASGAHVAWKVLGVVVLAVDVALAAMALVGLGFHNATDTIGSMLLCLAATTGGALVLDQLVRLLFGSAHHSEAPSGVHPEVGNQTSGRTTV